MKQIFDAFIGKSLFFVQLQYTEGIGDTPSFKQCFQYV